VLPCLAVTEIPALAAVDRSCPLPTQMVLPMEGNGVDTEFPSKVRGPRGNLIAVEMRYATRRECGRLLKMALNETWRQAGTPGLPRQSAESKEGTCLLN
jgi:hypothetical protein